MSVLSPHRCAVLAMLCASAAAIPSGGTTYYVSPTGNDQNSGTNPQAAWGSVQKVDATNFNPGDQILFQYGSDWHASLSASSSGTTTAPIAYGAYGNPKLGNPTFFGSDPVNASAFTLVSGTTYKTTYTTPVNWVYSNHQITHEAADALGGQGSNPNDPLAQLNYVQSNPNSFYYSASDQQLYVNTGSAPLDQSISVGTREDAILSNRKSNLIFQNLNATETAMDNGGYGVRIEFGSNIKLINSKISLAGKHSVGVIDVVGFSGTNLVADGNMPDQPFGSVNAFAAYADANPVVPTGSNTTSTWTNLKYTNPNGGYSSFISHGNAGGTANITINNIVASGYGTGVYIDTTGPNETTVINGGHLDGSSSSFDTNNSVVNGLTVSGAGGSFSLKGTHDVIQNSTFIGSLPNPYQGRNGAIVDAGTNNTIQFNVLDTAIGGGPMIGVTDTAVGTNIKGNILSPATGVTWLLTNGTPSVTSDYNLINPQAGFATGTPNFRTDYSLQQWQAMGYDSHSTLGTPQYVDSVNGIYMLMPASAGVGTYATALNPLSRTSDQFLGPANANGTYNAGLNPAIWPNMNVLPTTLFLNNSQTNVVSPAGGTLAISNTGSLISGRNAALDIDGSVNNAGTFFTQGSLIVTGDFNNSGSAIIAGEQIWIPGATFNNTAGNAIIQTDSGGTVAPQESLAINASGGTVTLTLPQHLASLTVGAAAKVVLESPVGNSKSALFVPSLAVVGTLDLGSNDLIVEGGNLNAVNSMLRLGISNGTLNSPGIISSLVAEDSTHSLGLAVVLNSIDGVTPLYGIGTALGTFDGFSPGPTDVLIKLTYIGDTNLDGRVDGSDYARVDNGYLQHLSGWNNGDFNYDGTVNGSDYTLIDNAYNRQGAVITSSIAESNISSSVPEPSAIAVAMIASPLLLRRRKQ